MRPLHLVLVALLVVVDALCFVAIEAGTEAVPPLRFAGLRAGLGGGTLLIGSLAMGRAVLPSRKLWPGIVGLALLGTTLGYSAMFMSPGAAGTGISSVVGNTGPVFLVLFGMTFLSERLTRVKVEALFLAGVGVVLIAASSPGSAAHGGLPSSGIPTVAIPLAAAAAAAGATVLLKRMAVGDEVVRVAMWQLLLGSIPILGLSFVLESASGPWTPGAAWILAFLAILGTAGAVSVWYWLVQREQVTRLGILMFAIPVLGLMFAWITSGENPGPLAGLGMATVLAGLLHLARREMAPVRTAETPPTPLPACERETLP